MARFFIALIALAFLVTGYMANAAGSAKVVRQFCTDGCSNVGGLNSKYLACCVLHDYAYYVGGSADERMNADSNLRMCMQRVDSKSFWPIFRPGIFEMGVSAFGDVAWGSAWGGSREFNFEELSKDERAEIAPYQDQVANLIERIRSTEDTNIVDLEDNNVRCDVLESGK